MSETTNGKDKINFEDLLDNGGEKESAFSKSFRDAVGGGSVTGHAHSTNDEGLCDSCGVDHDKVDAEFRKRFGSPGEYFTEYLHKESDKYRELVQDIIGDALGEQVARTGENVDGLHLIMGISKVTKDIAMGAFPTNDPMQSIARLMKSAELAKKIMNVIGREDGPVVLAALTCALELKAAETSTQVALQQIAKDLGYLQD